MTTRTFVIAFTLAVLAQITAELILRKMRTTAPVLAFSKPSGTCGCGCS